MLAVEAEILRLKFPANPILDWRKYRGMQESAGVCCANRSPQVEMKAANQCDAQAFGPHRR
jgi:putative hemolysin